MLIDRTHRPWLIFSGAGLAVAAIGYVMYSAMVVGGPRGGSAVGLTYGIIGYAFMLFAGLIGLRKKYPIVRVGRATTWMRGHLWLGLLSFPLILFHAAFSLGAGSLTRALMVLFIVVIISGIFGAVLQHFLPRLLTERVQLETVYEQIDSVRGQLLEEAEKLVADLRSALEGDLSFAEEKQRAMAASAGTVGGLTFASGLGASEFTSQIVADFFDQQLRPFLLHSGGHHCALADKGQASGMFSQLRVQLPRNFWPKLADLESLCDEKRGLDRQRRMHHVLHGWLFVHIPISYALLLLAAVHAVFALRY
ncbi:MAG: hypothetical protein JOZ80_16345 [Acidobacteriaceae bacterium]|nr:hypothetical protein [Acidobacteriaceae bacterium]